MEKTGCPVLGRIVDDAERNARCAPGDDFTVCFNCPTRYATTGMLKTKIEITNSLYLEYFDVPTRLNCECIVCDDSFE